MIVFITQILVLLNLWQLPSDDSTETKTEYTVNKIDLSADTILCKVLDDALNEDSIMKRPDNIYYKVSIQDKDYGTLISITRLSKNLMNVNDGCVGIACYKGQTIMLNGNGKYINKLKKLPEVITIGVYDNFPSPDGIENWIYKVIDGNCFRFFIKMGLLLLPDPEKSANINNNQILTLPNRKFKKNKP